MEIGAKLPKFTAQITGGESIKSSDLIGKNVILYFYPKDCTSGCTRQGQDFRDLYKKFKAKDTVIFGISRDSLKSHENFKAKESFPFELIADPEEELCQLFDVIKMKNMYGKKVRGIERSTFLFDKKGTLKKIWRKVKVDGHVEEVLETIKTL